MTTKAVQQIRLQFSSSLADKVKKYRRVYEATAKLIYGDEWDTPFWVAVGPDLDAYEPELAKLPSPMVSWWT